MSKDNALLEDILQAGKAIRRVTEGVSLADFKAGRSRNSSMRWS